MIKIILALLFGIFATTAFASEYIQPRFNGFAETINYIDRIYFKTDSVFGIAGYKTIDKMVYLEKSEFNDFSGNKIFMVQTLPDKHIVGYGIKVWDSEFALEDSNCDGIMDKVFLYNTPVFPPDCWIDLKTTMNELGKDLAELHKELYYD